jgi:hypothetical protein
MGLFANVDMELSILQIQRHCMEPTERTIPTRHNSGGPRQRRIGPLGRGEAADRCRVRDLIFDG